MIVNKDTLKKLSSRRIRKVLDLDKVIIKSEKNKHDRYRLEGQYEDFKTIFYWVHSLEMDETIKKILETLYIEKKTFGSS